MVGDPVSEVLRQTCGRCRRRAWWFVYEGGGQWRCYCHAHNPYRRGSKRARLAPRKRST